jgi:hypothetical protein
LAGLYRHLKRIEERYVADWTEIDVAILMIGDLHIYWSGREVG